MKESPARFAQISADQTREMVWLDVLKAIELVYTK
jgi:hypothetical protein